MIVQKTSQIAKGDSCRLKPKGEGKRKELTDGAAWMVMRINAINSRILITVGGIGNELW